MKLLILSLISCSFLYSLNWVPEDKSIGSWTNKDKCEQVSKKQCFSFDPINESIDIMKVKEIDGIKKLYLDDTLQAEKIERIRISIIKTKLKIMVKKRIELFGYNLIKDNASLTQEEKDIIAEIMQELVN